VPAGHKKHWEDPIKEYFPALQRVQFFSEVDPEIAGLKEPARQRVHAEEEGAFFLNARFFRFYFLNARRVHLRNKGTCI